MNKFFFFDMDGTIVDINSNVRPETEVALIAAREKGHKLAIATGRPFSDIVRDVKKEQYDYLIANNGAYYYNVSTKEFHHNGSVDKTVALELLKIAEETKSMYAVHCNGQAYRGNFQEGRKVEDINNDPNEDIFEYFAPEFIKEKIEKHEVAQVSLKNEPEEIERLRDEFKPKFNNVEMHIANYVYLDINPTGVSKLLGVKSVLEHENMSLEQAVGFGDSGNDLDMVEGVGLGVAMGNGTEELKEVADIVIGNNNSDAIGKKVMELI